MREQSRRCKRLTTDRQVDGAIPFVQNTALGEWGRVMPCQWCTLIAFFDELLIY